MLSGDCALACLALINSASIAGYFLLLQISVLIVMHQESQKHPVTLSVFGIVMLVSAFIALMLRTNTVRHTSHLRRN